MQTTKSLKSQAKLLRAHFATHQIELTHSQCLEAVAASHAFKSWRAAEALLPPDSGKAEEPQVLLTPLRSQSVGEAIQANVQAAFQIASKHPTPGSRIAIARLSLGYTQVELSAITGIPLADLKRIESERSDPLSSELAALLKSGINPLWVIAGQTPMLTAASNQKGDARKAADKKAVVDEINSVRASLMNLLESHPSIFSDHPDRGSKLVSDLNSDIDLFTDHLSR